MFALESLTGGSVYINSLINTNPVGATDPKSQGDDHIRGIKNTIRNTFPNITGAVTATHTELNYTDVTTLGTQQASKCVTTDANVNSGISKITQLHIGASGSETQVTSTAAELNILDGVTSTAAELNILDGVTATATELNYVAGVTSAIQTQMNLKAPLISPTFTTPALGTPSSGVATNLTGTATALNIGGNAATATTSTTQTYDNNTTKIATTAYVDRFHRTHTIKASRSITQSIAHGTFTQVSLNSAAYDKISAVDTTDFEIDVPTGWKTVKISASVTFDGNAVGERGIAIALDDSLDRIYFEPGRTGTWANVQSVQIVSSVFDVTGVSAIQLYVYQSSTASLDITGADIMVEYVDV